MKDLKLATVQSIQKKIHKIFKKDGVIPVINKSF